MIINADAVGLEINVAGFLSQDPILLQEIKEGFDLHSANQKMLGLPSRLIAKIFVFRLIYGGSAYAYSVDTDFASCKYSAKKWQEIIDKFYSKYKKLAQWHIELVQEVTNKGYIKMPTGREFHYLPKRNNYGDLEWPRTQILNYPVQGTGADIMSIARVYFYRKFIDNKIDGVLINTVHDSIECDVVASEKDRVISLFKETFQKVPENFTKLFGIEYNLPLRCEISYGNNRKDLTEVV
jgi:DNA polymerase-1